MNYYDDKLKKHDAASMTLAKIGLLLVLVLMAAQAFAGSLPAIIVQAGSIQTLPDGAVHHAVASEVNLEVNKMIVPKKDLPLMDKWEVKQAGDFGDCDDYAMTKRDMLLKAGYDSSQILIVSAIAMDTYEPHLMLLTNTDKGWYFLDNRFKVPVEMNSLVASGLYSFDTVMVEGKWLRLSDLL